MDLVVGHGGEPFEDVFEVGVEVDPQAFAVPGQGEDEGRFPAAVGGAKK